MNLSDIGIIFAICTPLAGGVGAAGKYYADHEYVTIASQNQKLLWDIEDEIAYLQSKAANGTITQAERNRLTTLIERKRHLTE